MAELRPTISLPDAELESIFYQTDDGKHYRRTSTTGKFFSQAITYQIDGIRKSQKTATDTVQRLPALPDSPLAERKAIIITNLDELNTLYFHTNEVFSTGFTEGSTDGGHRVGPGETFNSAASPDIIFWFKMENTKTARFEFTEVR